jgi:hypothetical protein
VKADLLLPVLELLPDGSYSSVLFRAGLHDKARAILTAAARAGENLDGDKAVAVRSFPPVLAVHLLSGFAPTAGSEPLACWPSPSIRPSQAAERHSSADGEEGQPPDGGVAVDG